MGKLCCLDSVGSIVLTDYTKRKNKTASGLLVGEPQMFTVAYETATTNSTRVDTRYVGKPKSECQREVVTGMTLKISSACFEGHFAEGVLAAGAIDIVGDELSETFALWKDQIISLSQIPDLTIDDIVVTSNPGSTIYVEGIDYEFVEGAGHIQIKSLLTGSIPNPTVTTGVGAVNVTITYTSVNAKRFILGAMVGRYYRLDVAGVGESTYKASFYKVRVKPSSTLTLINDGLDGSLLEADLEVVLDSSEVNATNGIFKGFADLDVSLLEEV